MYFTLFTQKSPAILLHHKKTPGLFPSRRFYLYFSYFSLEIHAIKGFVICSLIPVL